MSRQVNGAQLDIQMLGDFRIKFEGKQLPAFPTKESETLFIYLLINRNRCFHRDALIEKLFVDQPLPNARKRLRNDLWRVRSTLEPDGVPAGTFLIVTNREVGFNTCCQYDLDCERFERLLGYALSSEDVPLCSNKVGYLKEAIALYRGDLLEGVYDEWCLWEKERIKMLYLRGMEALMNHHAAKAQWNRAIILGEQLIKEDPLREHIHRSLMRFYYLSGDRPTALVRYMACARLLDRELNIAPMKVTTQLYTKIKDECMEQFILEDPAEVGRKAQGIGLLRDYLHDIHKLSSQLDNLSVGLKKQIQSAEEHD